MTTLAKALETYIKDQLDPEDNNNFELNGCDHPEVARFINNLNYVSLEFIMKYFSDNTIKYICNGEDICIVPWESEYFTIELGRFDCIIYHSTDSTTTGISTGGSGLEATDEQITHFSNQLSKVIEFINEHYVGLIDTMVGDVLVQTSGSIAITRDELEKSLKLSQENDHLLERLDGKKYGYPKCCVESFCQDLNDMDRIMSPERGERKLTGTGYIPCVECNEKYSVEQLINNINLNRSAHIEPFHKHI